MTKCGLLTIVVVGVLAGCKGKDKKADTAGSAAGSGSGSAMAGSGAAGSAGAAMGSGAGSAMAGSAAGSAMAGSGSAAAPATAAYCGANPCPCKAGTEQKTGDKLDMCELEKTTVIGSASCEPGRLLFHDTGTLEECLLSADTAVGDYTCKKAPLTTSWHPDGKLRACSLAKEATVGGITITAGRGIALHADGKLRNAWSEKPVTIDGWSCNKNTYLFASGKLEACVVTAAGKVGTQDVPAGSMIRLSEDGKLVGLELGAAGKVDGAAAKAGDRYCWEGGKAAKSQTCFAF